MLERNTKAAAPTIPEIAAQYDRVALVFQGGGALGAYQAGVYQALAEAGCEPTWLSGVSIGAVNAAIIAGNEPSRRLQRLEQFWQIISGRKIWAYTPEGDFFRDIRNRTSSWMTMTMGQPGFFKPRFPNPWLELPGAEGATSFYDSAELKKTLEMLIDFDLLNDGKKRFSVGAVNVRTGNFVYFDTDKVRIGPEHIMASGALPPALPSVRIEGEYYWDGGIVSNTPLQYLLDQEEDRSSLVFQVDLFSARGVLPRSMPDVLSRHKDIMYSSRTRQNTDNFKRIHGLKMKLLGALKRVPRDQLSPEEEELIADYSDAGVVNIVHLIYQHKNYEGHAKDYEFSGTSMREHWDMGLEDTKRTLRHSEWLLPPFSDDAVAIHDLHREDPV
ncbi:patatin-like phospholipase family protein [Rhizobium sp. P40RR-XXII]|uniref:patatin-like phospholipase family protein n=1 Tax=unclassified Rhizobium TaxID=2613769 RepID=UPI00145638F3|nr:MULTISPECIES: patatin-like phospholipase family protein [unclassified Rhizobium]NLR84741.1 patatin-like phospholipase family protein [Rhizobium sp. P28RR-XV]NLS16352.1 patatin-like phospholipase family protein [Rhizobium sp. P40RR-XXII]